MPAGNQGVTPARLAPAGAVAGETAAALWVFGAAVKPCPAPGLRGNVFLAGQRQIPIGLHGRPPARRRVIPRGPPFFQNASHHARIRPALPGSGTLPAAVINRPARKNQSRKPARRNRSACHPAGKAKPLKSCREREKTLRTVSEFTRSGSEPIQNKSYAQHQIILPFNSVHIRSNRRVADFRGVSEPCPFAARRTKANIFLVKQLFILTITAGTCSHPGNGASITGDKSEAMQTAAGLPASLSSALACGPCCCIPRQAGPSAFGNRTAELSRRPNKQIGPFSNSKAADWAHKSGLQLSVRAGVDGRRTLTKGSHR